MCTSLNHMLLQNTWYTHSHPVQCAGFWMVSCQYKATNTPTAVYTTNVDTDAKMLLCLDRSWKRWDYPDAWFGSKQTPGLQPAMHVHSNGWKTLQETVSCCSEAVLHCEVTDHVSQPPSRCSTQSYCQWWQIAEFQRWSEESFDLLD